MTQIKTIHERDAQEFDEAVNKALADGWSLTRRYSNDYGFFAELVKKERTCNDCSHQNSDPYKEPCSTCNEEYSKWTPITEPAGELN